nr:1022_t:CDS:2 [Entrophospora candida]
MEFTYQIDFRPHSNFTYPSYGTSEYNDLHLRSLLASAKTSQELQPVKVYLLRYFAHADVGVYRWMPRTQTFKHYNKGDACEFLIPCGTKKVINDEGEVINEFSFLSWFLNKTPFFALEVNTTHSHVYQAPDGGEVLCSSDKKQELYDGINFINSYWPKMQKSMFLYSGAGTGKTMLTWFLQGMVLGPKITHKTTNERIITTQFNKELKGKVLLVLEEMSNSKSGDWIAFANQLKDFIDSDTLMIEEKHNTSYPVTNVTNLNNLFR